MRGSTCLTGACLALLLAACQGASTAAPTQAATASAADAVAPAAHPANGVDPPAGRYSALGPAHATLEISEAADGHWQLALRGGALPDGGATAADCELQARGALETGRIDATVVPFEGLLMSVTEADLAAAPSRVTVTLDGARASVDADTGLCPMGTTFDGDYQRSAGP